MTVPSSTNVSAQAKNSYPEFRPEIVPLLSETLEIILSAQADGTASTRSATQLQSWIADNPKDTLITATTASQIFLQNNWTGPPSPFDANFLDKFHDRALKFLGEPDPVYRLCRAPEHLVLAIVMLEEHTRLESSDVLSSRELLKVYWMHQCVLEEKSSVLYEKITNLLKKMDCSADQTDSSVVELLLLACNINMFYGDFSRANDLLTDAKRHNKHSSLLTGILGKRTQFQDVDYAQLVVELTGDERSGGLDAFSSHPTLSVYPLDVALDDDTLLKQAKLTQELPQYRIADHDAAVLLVEGLVSQRKKARTDLQDEELFAYLQMVLQSSHCYAVRECALFHRSKLEGVKPRKTTRAMQQLETLMASFRDPAVSTALRLPFALAVNLPPSWQVEEALGFLLLQNGCTNDAINIFTALELWGDVIECYQRIGQKVKAEDLIMKELAKEETPSMWCRLGDIREDVGCYDKAWELSNGHSARSRRDLGKLLLRRQDYTGAAAALLQGLGVNSIDAGTWFSLGYCQLKIGEFGPAEHSFRRCVNLDPENSLAWNNLGSIALRNQDYPKAYRILQDSIKADYDNWNVWDNYQNACLKVKDFEEEIKACYRLLELRGKLNVDSLALLVVAVADGVIDIHGSSAVRLLPKVKELFGALAVKLADNSKLFYLYAKLSMAELNGMEDTNAKKELLQSVVQKLQRSFRYATKEKDWEREDCTLIPVLTVAKELGKNQQLLMALEADDGEIRSIRSSSRVMLDNVISMVQKSRGDFLTGNLVLSDDGAKIFDEIQMLRSKL